MIEAEIHLSDELAAKALLRSQKRKAIKDSIKILGGFLGLVWIIVAILDFVYQTGSLIFFHFVFLFGLFLILVVTEYYLWKKKIAETNGWSFHAKLDDQEVVVTYTYPEIRRYWASYKSYEEFDEYLQIESMNGEISFVPKTPELFDLIEFTKRRIPRK